MDVLKLNKALLQWTGLVSLNKRPSTFVRVAYFVNLIFPILLGVPCVAYFCANVTDVAEATNSLYFIGILGMTIAKFVFYSRQSDNIFAIISSFQQIVDQRKWLWYEKWEKFENSSSNRCRNESISILSRGRSKIEKFFKIPFGIVGHFDFILDAHSDCRHCDASRARNIFVRCTPITIQHSDAVRHKELSWLYHWLSHGRWRCVCHHSRSLDLRWISG